MTNSDGMLEATGGCRDVKMEEARCCGFGSVASELFRHPMALGPSALSRAARPGVWLGSEYQAADCTSTKLHAALAEMALNCDFTFLGGIVRIV